MSDDVKQEVCINSIMPYSEWAYTINELKWRIEELDHKITYRAIQIIGPREFNSPGRHPLDEDMKKLDSDLLLINLRDQKSRLEEKLVFIKRTGHMPIPETEDIIL